MSGLGRMTVYFTGVLLAAAAAVFGITVADALRGGRDDLAEVGVPREAAGPSVPVGEAGAHVRDVYPRASEEEILEAVNQDLFMPRRTPPLERYQLPGQRPVSPVAEAQDPRRRRGPEIRVVGSAFAGGKALALIQVGDSIPLAVLLGEEVEGYVLAAVDEEGATLVGESETLDLPVVASLATGRSATAGADLQSPEALQERVQQMLRAQMMNVRRQNPNRGGRGGGQP